MGGLKCGCFVSNAGKTWPIRLRLQTERDVTGTWLFILRFVADDSSDRLSIDFHLAGAAFVQTDRQRVAFIHRRYNAVDSANGDNPIVFLNSSQSVTFARFTTPLRNEDNKIKQCHETAQQQKRAAENLLNR